MHSSYGLWALSSFILPSKTYSMHLPSFPYVSSTSCWAIEKNFPDRPLGVGYLFFAALFGTSIQGAVTVERWEDVRGNNIVNLIQSPVYPQSPSSIGVINTFSTQRSGNHYGQRLRAVLTVAQSGHRVFRIAGDDQCHLVLTGDAGPYLNKSTIASVPGWTRPGQWNR